VSGADAVRCPECGGVHSPDKLEFRPRISYELLGYALWPWPVFAVSCIVIPASAFTSAAVHFLDKLSMLAAGCSMLTLIVGHLLKGTPQPRRSLPILFAFAAIYNGTFYGMGWVFTELIAAANC
jgi:hypothetical protein